VWLTGANDIDSKTFSRAILAKVLFASICLHFDDMRSLMALLNGSIIKWSLNELASQEGRQSFDHDVYET
jgi:SRSO17 transposase